jgi:FKBP12-rapamycin complex-associated protein
MRCLHALGEWEQLSQLAQEKWFSSDDETKKLIAPLAAAAAWGLGQWELMDDYNMMMKSDSPDGVFFRAILAIHRNLFAQAEESIDKTRELLDTELKALVGESYSRAYR